MTWAQAQIARNGVIFHAIALQVSRLSTCLTSSHLRTQRRIMLREGSTVSASLFRTVLVYVAFCLAVQTSSEPAEINLISLELPEGILYLIFELVRIEVFQIDLGPSRGRVNDERGFVHIAIHMFVHGAHMCILCRSDMILLDSCFVDLAFFGFDRLFGSCVLAFGVIVIRDNNRVIVIVVNVQSDASFIVCCVYLDWSRIVLEVHRIVATLSRGRSCRYEARLQAILAVAINRHDALPLSEICIL